MVFADDEVVKERLGALLVGKKPALRMRNRGWLARSMGPRPPLIWGGTHERYLFWWGTCFVASLAFVGIFGLWVSGLDGTMPGGFSYLLLWFLVLLAGPSFAFVQRRRGLRRRKPIDAVAFEAGMFHMAPGIPKEFALVVRNALAAAYCVPPELIGHDDTRRRSKALSLMSEPLAMEVIADVAWNQDIEFNLERICSAAEAFRTRRASTVAELVGLIYHAMLSAGLLEDKVSG